MPPAASAPALQHGQIDGAAALCFPALPLAPGETGEVCGSSDEYVLRLATFDVIVAAEGAEDLRLIAWRVGDDPWASPGGAARCSTFVPGRYLGGGVSFARPALPGTPVALRVENTGAVPRIFRCGFAALHLRRPR